MANRPPGTPKDGSTTWATLTDAHLALLTPCDDFSVTELVEHLVGSISGIGQALGAVITDDAGASPEVRVANAAAPTLEAFATRGLEGTIGMASPSCRPPRLPTS